LSNISKTTAREILDSRGNPTIEVDILLSDGSIGRASVPSGASTGSKEAVELRDRDLARYNGLGVLKAVEIINQKIAPALIGKSALDQNEIDNLLIKMDGTHNKSLLGGNSILGVSMAIARAASKSIHVPLYLYLSQGQEITLPVPMFNVLNGGKHAENSTDFQEFMVVPAGFETFSDAIRAGTEIYHSLKNLLKTKNLSTAVGDEGGFAVKVKSNRDALELVLQAIHKAGYSSENECFIALDVAANELVTAKESYLLANENLNYSTEELVSMYEEWVKKYPIISIEDGISENDWDGWKMMTKKLSDQIQLVGDDIYATNTQMIIRGIESKASNAVLIKLNQVGTVTETLEAISLAKKAGWGTVISHRSGETEDTTIADLSIATSAGQIKSGAPARGERTAKYNRIIRIEESLGKKAKFAGLQCYNHIRKS
jgi:enolase